MRNAKSVVAALAVIGSVLVGGAGAVAGATTVPSCTPGQMSLRVGHSNGAAGTIYYPIIFTNTGGKCVIWGVPHIQPVAGAQHSSVGPAAANASMGEMPARHTLAKGQSVSVDYGVAETGNFTPSACVAKKASGVLVSLAPFVRSTYLKLAISVCTKTASTHTRLLSPGTTGV